MPGLRAVKKYQKKANKILEIDQMFFDREDIHIDEHSLIEGFGYNLFDSGKTPKFRERRRSSSYLKISHTNDSHEEINLINQEGWGFIESLKDIHKHY